MTTRLIIVTADSWARCWAITMLSKFTCMIRRYNAAYQSATEQ